MDKIIKIVSTGQTASGTSFVKDSSGEKYFLSKKKEFKPATIGGMYKILYNKSEWPVDSGKFMCWIDAMYHESDALRESLDIPKKPNPEANGAAPKPMDSNTKPRFTGDNKEILMAKENAMNNACNLAVAFLNYMVASGEAKKLTEAEMVLQIEDKRKGWFETFLSELVPAPKVEIKEEEEMPF